MSAELDVDSFISNLFADKLSIEEKKDAAVLITDTKPVIKKKIFKKPSDVIKEIPTPPSNIKDESKVEKEEVKVEIEETDENTTLIDIDTYKNKFTEYPSDLQEFAKENDIKLLAITSMRGQALALMAQPEVRGKKHLGRDEAVKFFQNINMETKDAIQQFNKATGLKKILKKGAYCLKYPFECDKVHIDKRKGAKISGDRDAQINQVKDWWRETVIDVPNDEWQIGHLDPTIDDASEKNLAFQPPIQGKYRDRFKFCPYFHKMWPTAKELVQNMSTYYTEEEQEILYNALNKSRK